MQKKPDSSWESRFFEGIRLYRDDIELILSVFQENEYTVEITDEEFQFDSLDELIDKRGIAPTNFKFSGHKKDNIIESVNFSLDKKRIHVFAHSFAMETPRIIAMKIREICESRKSRIYKILNPWFYFFSASILIGPTVSLLTMTKDKERALSDNTWLIILSFAFLIAAISSFLYRSVRQEVILRRKHKGGFWKQNSDKIWLLLLGALIAMFLKFILDLLR